MIAQELPNAGFSFENCQRNEYLLNKNYKPPKVTKTGTTIVGLMFADGVILGADTRATAGSIIAQKNCQKLSKLQENMYCCGAGTAADLHQVSHMLASQLELHRLSTGKEVPVAASVRLLKQYLFRYQGYVSAAIIIGGVDKTGPHLHSVAPHGSSFENPYVTMGSGSLGAIAILQSGWRPNLPLEEAKKLVRDAVCAGILYDEASGNNVDICVITKEGAKFYRPYEEVVKKGIREGKYEFKKGTAPVLSTKILKLEVEETMVRQVDIEPMDTA